MQEAVPTVRANQRAFIFILVTMALDGTGLGLILPVIPALLVELSAQSVALAAIYGGWLTGLCALVQFFAAPVLGSLSDRFGRRPVLLRSLAAFGAYYLVLGLAPSIVWLTVGMVLAGAFGATVSAANAYVTDVTEPEQRAERFGMIAAASGTGFVLGPLLVGLLERYGTRLPFFVAAGLALLNVVFGFLALPESLRLENRRPFSMMRSHPVAVFVKMVNQVQILPLLSALALMQIAAMTVFVMWGYFTILKFGWSQGEIGLSLSLSSAAGVVVQSALVSRVNRRLGNLRTACLGFSCMIIGLLGYAFATRGWIMLAFIVPSALGSMTGAALISQMSNRVAPDSQGELHGAVASMGGLAGVITPPLMTHLFSSFTADNAVVHLPGIPYFLGALLACVGLLLTLHAFRRDALLVP